MAMLKTYLSPARMCCLLSTVAAALLLTPALPARAGGDLIEYDAPPPSRACREVLTAEGCYWHRGERYCSRYCYIEVNGRRYCNKRRDEAIPQASCEEPVPPEVLYRRPRHPYRY